MEYVKSVLIGLGIVWGAMVVLEMSTVSVIDAQQLVSSARGHSGMPSKAKRKGEAITKFNSIAINTEGN